MKTKRLFRVIALMIGMCVALVSCTKEQSELSLSNISGSATITGQVRYNQGTVVDESGTTFEGYLVPVASTEIYVELQLSDYDSSASGVERISTVTDEQGNFSFKIPVGQNGINATINVLPFVGNYGQWVNGVLCSYDDAVYQDIAAESFSAKDGEQKVVNIEISDAPIFTTESISNSLTVSGSIDIYKEVIDYTDGYTTNGKVIAALAALDSAYAYVEISNPYNDNRTITYSLSVSSGVFSEDILFYDSWDYDDIYITLVSTNLTRFTHYYQTEDSDTFKVQYITGSYNSIKTVQSLSSYNPTVTSTSVFPTKTLYFTPDTTTGIYGVDTSLDGYEYSNPMSW